LWSEVTNVVCCFGLTKRNGSFGKQEKVANLGFRNQNHSSQYKVNLLLFYVNVNDFFRCWKVLVYVHHLTSINGNYSTVKTIINMCPFV
jgi:hypothetical protein